MFADRLTPFSPSPWRFSLSLPGWQPLFFYNHQNIITNKKNKKFYIIIFPEIISLFKINSFATKYFYLEVDFFSGNNKVSPDSISCKGMIIFLRFLQRFGKKLEEENFLWETSVKFFFFNLDSVKVGSKIAIISKMARHIEKNISN
jgi:hypothetical protein